MQIERDHIAGNYEEDIDAKISRGQERLEIMVRYDRENSECPQSVYIVQMPGRRAILQIYRHHPLSDPNNLKRDLYRGRFDRAMCIIFAAATCGLRHEMPQMPVEVGLPLRNKAHLEVQTVACVVAFDDLGVLVEPVD